MKAYVCLCEGEIETERQKSFVYVCGKVAQINPQRPQEIEGKFKLR